ncbi:MAG: DUF2357 domain-containing protein [Anaerolineae bacterium]|nr:DUF2357 domain-containing protein [Anaerolineae bacterium]
MSVATIKFVLNSSIVALLRITARYLSTKSGMPYISTNVEKSLPGVQVILLEGAEYEYELIPQDGNEEIKLRNDGNLSRIIRPRIHNARFGTLNTGLNTGCVTLFLADLQDHVMSTALIEVHSHKIDYLSDYRTMLDEIGDQCVELALDLFSASHIALSNVPLTENLDNLQSRLAFLTGLIASREFSDAIERIFTMPVSQLITDEANAPVRRGIKDAASAAHQLLRGTKRITIPSDHPLADHFTSQGHSTPSIPETIRTGIVRETRDVPENQFIKHVLVSFLSDLGFIKDLIANPEYSNVAAPILAEITLIQSQLEDWIRNDLLANLSKLKVLPLGSPVLQRRNGYRKVFHSWLTYSLLSRISWEGGEEDIYKGGSRNVAKLYEYWLFFTLLTLLRTNYGTDTYALHELFTIAEDGIRLNLKAGQNLTIRGRFSPQLKYEFKYNYTFGQSLSWSLSLRPDFTLTVISSSDTTQQAHLHFDAKYRIQVFPPKEELISKLISNIDDPEMEAIDLHSTFKQDDLVKMHAYRDAIHNTLGAYVLYPGDNSTPVFFRRDETTPIAEIGAFALVPGDKALLSLREIKKHLDSVIKYLSEKWSGSSY